MTEIDGYTDYACEKVFGADSVTGGDIVDVTVQGKSKWAYVFFSGAATGVYLHQFEADLTNTERPTYSLQKDGFQDNFLYAGYVVDQLSLSAALKAMVEGETSGFGLSEDGSQSASSLNLEDVDPLIFHKGDLSLGENEYTYTRNVSIQIQNNHEADAGFGFGSAARQAHEKGMFDATGSLQLRLDANSFAERAKVFSNTRAALSFYFKGGWFDQAANLPEMILAEVPYVALSQATYQENGQVIDLGFDWRALNPGGGNYDPPLTISMLTVDSAEY